jgi:hypothetical protein
MISNIRELALDIAQELILHPNRLARGYTARDADGIITDPKSKSARYWCVIGMISKREPDGGWDVNSGVETSVIPLIRQLGDLHGALADFNDLPSTTPELMIKFLRKVADNPLAASIELRSICIDNPPSAA